MPMLFAQIHQDLSRALASPDLLALEHLASTSTNALQAPTTVTPMLFARIRQEIFLVGAKLDIIRTVVTGRAVLISMSVSCRLTIAGLPNTARTQLVAFSVNAVGPVLLKMALLVPAHQGKSRAEIHLRLLALEGWRACHRPRFVFVTMIASVPLVSPDRTRMILLSMQAAAATHVMN